MLTLAILVSSQFIFSQNFKRIAEYEFKTAKDYQKEEATVVQCVNYLYDTPVNLNEAKRAIATQFIMKWMTGTPDYTFEIGPKAIELTNGGSKELFGMYLAALTKVGIENKGKKLSDDKLHQKAQAYLVAYCANSVNKIKASKQIKKLIKEMKK